MLGCAIRQALPERQRAATYWDTASSREVLETLRNQAQQAHYVMSHDELDALARRIKAVYDD